MKKVGVVSYNPLIEVNWIDPTEAVKMAPGAPVYAQSGTKSGSAVIKEFFDALSQWHECVIPKFGHGPQSPKITNHAEVGRRRQRYESATNALKDLERSLKP